jgi:hypothetical protein
MQKMKPVASMGHHCKQNKFLIKLLTYLKHKGFQQNLENKWITSPDIKQLQSIYSSNAQLQISDSGRRNTFEGQQSCTCAQEGHLSLPHS